MEIKVVYTLQQAEEAIAWFLQGDLSVIALDTETMGKKWFELQNKHKHTSYDKASERRKAESEIKACANDALYPTKNYLATLQLASTDQRILICVMKQSAVSDRVAQLLKQLTNSTTWLIQNAKFDLKQLDYHLGLSPQTLLFWDTMLTEILINGNRNNDSASLKFLAQRYPSPKGMQKGSAASTVSDWWSNPLTEDQIQYCAMDVLLLHHIYLAQKEKIMNLGLERVQSLEFKLTPILVDIEKVGIKYDKDALSDFITKANQKYAELEIIFRDELGNNVNVNSGPQLLGVIQSKYGVIPMLSKWDQHTNTVIQIPSCDKFSLLECGLRGEPGIDCYIALKELGKNISMANDWLSSPDERFYTEYIQLKGARDDDSGGTRTGRMSSKPNLQNQSNFMKQFLVADDGWVIISADYSGIEMRLMASYANETVLKNLFSEGRDPHTEMAKWAFNMNDVDKKSRERRIAKEINFGFLYGMYARKFCSRVLRATGGEIRLSIEEGRKFRDDFFRRYPNIERWHQNQFAQSCIDGFVTTRSGRRRYYNPQVRPANLDSYGILYYPMRNQRVQSHYAPDWKWRNIAYNTPIQGTGGDGIKAAITELGRMWHHAVGAQVFATVHDSIDCFVKEGHADKAASDIQTAMVRGMAVYLKDVPIEVEMTYGKSWANPPSEHKSKFYRSDEDNNLWTQTQFQEPLKMENTGLI